MQTTHELFGLFVSCGSEDIGHCSSGSVSADASGRMNAHTSSAAFRRLPELGRSGGRGGPGGHASVVASLGDGPNPPTEEVSPNGASRFLFPGFLADAILLLGGFSGRERGSRSGFSPGPTRVEESVPWEDRFQSLNSSTVVGRQDGG